MCANEWAWRETAVRWNSQHPSVLECADDKWSRCRWPVIVAHYSEVSNTHTLPTNCCCPQLDTHLGFKTLQTNKYNKRTNAGFTSVLRSLLASVGSLFWSDDLHFRFSPTTLCFNSVSRQHVLTPNVSDTTASSSVTSWRTLPVEQSEEWEQTESGGDFIHWTFSSGTRVLVVFWTKSNVSDKHTYFTWSELQGWTW